MSDKPVKAYVSLGSNMGEREKNLQAAVSRLQQIPKTRVERVSGVYSTEPLGYLEQDDFLNAVAEISTTLDAEELLGFLQEIEHSLGRVRTIYWGPRTIDLDIILYGEEIIQTEKLTVPHPRAWERAFVLKPLSELQPDLLINGKSVLQYLTQASSQRIILFKAQWFDKLN